MFPIRRNPGFTLVELIVVVTVLAILATVGFVSMGGYSKDAREAAREYDTSVIGKAISHQSVLGTPVNVSKLKPVTFANASSDTNVWVWRGYPGLLSDLGKFPIDPSTWKPYVVGLLTSGTGWSLLLGQVGTQVESGISGFPLVKTKGSYESSGLTYYDPKRSNTAVPGLWSLIPRWEIENPDAFEATPFYLSWTAMYGAGVPNNYLFAVDGAPVRQLSGYSNTGTLLYESYEGITAQMENMVRTSTGWTINTCVSKYAATSMPYEFNTYYVDGLPTAICDVDKSTGSNSSSSLHMKWVRDSVGGDGQYAYAFIDPAKKYRFSLEAKGTLNAAVDGGKLLVRFACFRVNADRSKTSLGSLAYAMPLSPSAFSKISGYVNAPDPSGNGLSITVAAPGPATCILYRSDAPKTGDELWFDNHIVEEIP